jgi:guanylate kinase
VLIFLSAPLDELKSRLKGRATESPLAVELRMAKARKEIRDKGLFHYEVVNEQDKIEDAVNNLLHIVYAERCRNKDRETKEPPE